MPMLHALALGLVDWLGERRRMEGLVGGRDVLDRYWMQKFCSGKNVSILTSPSNIYPPAYGFLSTLSQYP